MVRDRPYILGIGGTTRPGSSSQRALMVALNAAEELGAEVGVFAGDRLDLPLYAPESEARTEAARELVEEVARADGLIIASPGYHGGVSGPVKNALDYFEDLREAPRPYVDGIAVGCIVCAYGWQATTTTLLALRSIVHALRGWPTPLGVTINSAQTTIDAQGAVSDAAVAANLELLARQVVEFAQLRMTAGVS